MINNTLKHKFRNLDVWIHDFLTIDNTLHTRRARLYIPKKEYDTRALLNLVHLYDKKRFGGVSHYRKIIILIKKIIYDIYLTIRKTILYIVFHLFVIRDKILGKL